MSSKLEIYPEPDGTFCIDAPHEAMICRNADTVGEYLEPFLWPMIKDGLKERKNITITVEYGTD